MDDEEEFDHEAWYEAYYRWLEEEREYEILQEIENKRVIILGGE